MKLASVLFEDTPSAAIVSGSLCFPVSLINRVTGSEIPVSLLKIIETGAIPDLKRTFAQLREKTGVYSSCAVHLDEIDYLPLFSPPGKIWGIGLNYKDHARDLSARQPEQYPAGFNKPATTVIGHDDTIIVPALSGKTTAEAELGVVIGKKGNNIPQEKWRDYVAGFVPVVDVTSVDILQLNPRYLSLSKSFNTYFSFGPVLYTPDEVPDTGRLMVSTVLNGNIVAENRVENMRFSPARLVSFMSRVFTWHAGDILSTGTPGAAVVGDGDRVEARISGFEPLENYVQIIP